MNSGIKQAMLASGAVIALWPAARGMAQVADPAASSKAPVVAPKTNAVAKAPKASIEDVVVTARSRKEKLKDVPVSISVITSKTLDALNLTDTTKVANFVPSVQFSNFAPGYFGGRLQARPLIFRGLNLANNYGVTAASLVFLDGAPLLGTELPVGLDIARVEVLRGPQSVYFGRSTLSGAINYVTKNVGNSWTGNAEVSEGSYNTRIIEGDASGPLIEDKLYAGIGASTTGNDGYYKPANAGGPSLGRQKTDSISLRLQATPTEDINIKAFFNYYTNNDGPAATIQIPSSANNCNLGGINNYYCGKLPYKQFPLYSFPDQNAASAANLYNGVLFPGGTFSPQYGVQRKALVMNVVGTWDLGFATFESRSAYEQDESLGAENGQLEPYKAGDLYRYYAFSLGDNTSNFTQEFRLRSRDDRRLRWTVGGSYVRGTDLSQAISVFDTPAPGVFNGGVGGNGTRSYGTFGGAYFDILPVLTLSAEARYQWDQRQGIIYQLPNLSKTFQSFSPRVALDYKITPDLSAYVSYAKGTRPGGFNTFLVPYLSNPAVLQQLTSQLGPIGTTYGEESLKSYEIGLKGSTLSHRVQFNVDFYYGTLSNEQVANYAFVPLLNNTLGGLSNIGQTNIYGVEFDGGWAPTDHISFTPSFAWNKTVIQNYLCTQCATYTGSSNVNGNNLGQAPVFSGSLIASVHYPLFNTHWGWYSTVAYVYRGATYIDTINVATIPDRSTVDLRAGLTKGNLTLEGFILNLTDNKVPVAGSFTTDFTSGQNTAFQLQLPPPRIFGFSLRYHFG